jgi:hypothetical protein
LLPLQAAALALPLPADAATDAPGDALGELGSLDADASAEASTVGEAAGGSDPGTLGGADEAGSEGDPVAVALPHAATTQASITASTSRAAGTCDQGLRSNETRPRALA